MAINVSQPFHRTSANAVDDTLTLTKAEMLAVNDNLMPNKYLTICQDDGDIYLYNKANTVDSTTGKFRKFEGGASALSALSDVDYTALTDHDHLEYDSTSSKWKNKARPSINNHVLASGNNSSFSLALHSMEDGAINSAQIDNTTYVPVSLVDGSTKHGYKITLATLIDFLKNTFQTILEAGTNVTISAGKINALATVDGFFNKSDLHSTTEKVVGCWVDGRPVYQKTISFGALPNTTTKSVAHGVSNIGNVIDSFGWASINGTYYDIPHVDANTTNDVQVSVSTTNINITTASDLSSATTAYVTIRYTKTTDAANSFNYADMNEYSTSEKIVGKWVDGSNLYQRTFTGTTGTGDSTTVASFSKYYHVRSWNGGFTQDSTNNIDVPIVYCFGTDATHDYMTPVTENGSIKLFYGSNNTGKSYWLTVQYTK